MKIKLGKFVLQILALQHGCRKSCKFLSLLAKQPPSDLVQYSQHVYVAKRVSLYMFRTNWESSLFTPFLYVLYFTSPGIKEGLYSNTMPTPSVLVLPRRVNNRWPAALTKAEVSPSLFTPLSPSLFTPHQILYMASLTPDTSDYLIRWTRTITELRQPQNNSWAPTPILWPDYHPSWLTCMVQDVAITNMNNKHIALV